MASRLLLSLLPGLVVSIVLQTQSKKPSGTANWVSAGRAINYGEGYTDDFVAACFATADWDGTKNCACQGEPKSEEEKTALKKSMLSPSAYAKLFHSRVTTTFDQYQRHTLIDRAVHKMGKFDQVVIIAAGMDGRAYRESSGMKDVPAIFEVDLPDTSSNKQALVKSCGLTPVNKEGGVQYLTWNAFDKHPFEFLANHTKFRKGGRTLFINEHMAEYLDEDANRHWLQELSRFSNNPKDRLIFLALNRNWMPWMGAHPQMNEEESWRFFLPEDRPTLTGERHESDEWMRNSLWAEAEGFREETREYKHAFMGVYRPIA